MRRDRNLILLGLIAAQMAAIPGCQTSRKITLRSQLAETARTSGTESITVFTKDRESYELVWYSLEDSVLQGTGMVRTDRGGADFAGEIPLSDIYAIQANSTSVLKGLVMTGAVAAFIAVSASEPEMGNGLDPIEDIQQHGPGGGGGGGTSCPYIYSWNGKGYVLEAEPFGVALGKALERTTYHLLPSAVAQDGIVRLRLTNERQETHSVNAVGLVAIETDGPAEVVLDAAGTAWPVTRPQSPRSAVDNSDRDILDDVASADGRMWECGPASVNPTSEYEDVLELAFAAPSRSADRSPVEVSLILRGINTRFSTVLYSQMSRMAGDQALALVHAIDTDPEMIDLLRRYLADASLSISLWNGHAWEPAGAFEPEANAVPFSRAVRIRVPQDAGDDLRIRLRSMADVWKIDALAVDWTPAAPLPAHPLPMLSAEADDDGADMLPLLLGSDDRYAVLLPPDAVELRFGAQAASCLLYTSPSPRDS
ncbi:MAG: hypothetical protein QUU85_17220, partial [Candidatus Eisenbacteria bacterium]|nr:hypothetical protein [Candidatus Eisenbacteria bacterium]